MEDFPNRMEFPIVMKNIYYIEIKSRVMSD